jgi:two-component system chemotaxis response regulator CheY
MARVLIVDDSPGTRQLLRTMMEAAGHDVVGQADNGRDGLELSQSLKPEVMLLDMLLPQLDGIEVLGRLKDASHRPKVVMLSSVTSVERIRAAKAAGADFYILKPFEVEKVVDTVALCVALKP